jgi:hypothetical protein
MVKNINIFNFSPSMPCIDGEKLNIFIFLIIDACIARIDDDKFIFVHAVQAA